MEVTLPVPSHVVPNDTPCTFKNCPSCLSNPEFIEAREQKHSVRLLQLQDQRTVLRKITAAALKESDDLEARLSGCLLLKKKGMNHNYKLLNLKCNGLPLIITAL